MESVLSGQGGLGPLVQGGQHASSPLAHLQRQGVLVGPRGGVPHLRALQADCALQVAALPRQRGGPCRAHPAANVVGQSGQAGT